VGVAAHVVPLLEERRCFHTDFRSNLGVLKVRIVPTGTASIRAAIFQGPECGQGGNRTMAAWSPNSVNAAYQQSLDLFVTQVSAPVHWPRSSTVTNRSQKSRIPIAKGKWSILVEGVDVHPGQSVNFDIAASNPLNSAAIARAAWSAALCGVAATLILL
jgi:hypothetical protein